MNKTVFLSLVVLAVLTVLSADAAKKPKVAPMPKMKQFKKVINYLWKMCTTTASIKGTNGKHEIDTRLSGKIMDVCIDVLGLSDETSDMVSLLENIRDNSQTGGGFFNPLWMRNGGPADSSTPDSGNVMSSTPSSVTKTKKKKSNNNKKKKTNNKWKKKEVDTSQEI